MRKVSLCHVTRYFPALPMDFWAPTARCFLYFKKYAVGLGTRQCSVLTYPDYACNKSLRRDEKVDFRVIKICTCILERFP